MGFLQPAALLFALPLAWLWWRTRPNRIAARAVRALCLACLVAALAGAYLVIGDEGRDLVVVVDRSRSMPTDALDDAEEIVRLAQSQRESGDRLSVVSFAARPAVEMAPSATEVFDGFGAELDPDGSDLAGALELALGLVPRERPGAILVLSDGATTTALPEGVAQRAAARGLSIFARPAERDTTVDLSVERIELPDAVGEGEPYQFSVWVRAARAETREFRLVREGRVLSSGERRFEPGLNRLVFRDVNERGGVAEYTVELGAEGDATPQNNRGIGSVLVHGAPRLLVLDEDGGDSTLARALALRGVEVDVHAPEDVRIDPVALTRYRGVVLENVDAGRLGVEGMEALVDFVTERGGGLLVTGGRASFGRGGYYRSALDPLLPVSLELRQEHRKQAVAMSIVMDRSGSMSQQVDAVRTKMDLANAGAAAAIETLGDIDSVSVIAVDTQPHVQHDQAELATNRGALLSRVRRIQSQGGGIYCYNGLAEAVRQLSGDPRYTKHIILFADAADSEQQEGCLDLLRDAAKGGVTCSVIALGTGGDADAEFLRQVAAVGGGTVAFTQSPSDLPRLFAQDTLLVARQNFVERPTGTEAQPGLLGLGRLPGDTFPTLGGYNLTYARPDATVAVVTTDEYRAPVLAFAYRGLGRAAAYTGQVGGQFGASLAEWDAFAGFAAGLARWLLGTEEPGGLFASVERDGSDARFTLELDVDAPIPARLGRLSANVLLPGGEAREIEFERTSATTFEARTNIPRAGTALATVTLPDGTAFSLPPVSLPFSPEFERTGVDPSRLLTELALDSGGRVLATATELFEGERGRLGSRSIARELLLVALLLMLVEIAFRRLALWDSLARRRPRPLRRRSRSQKPSRSAKHSRSPKHSSSAKPSNSPREVASAPNATSDDAHDHVSTPARGPAGPAGLGGALDAARRRASNRLGRDGSRPDDDRDDAR